MDIQRCTCARRPFIRSSRADALLAAGGAERDVVIGGDRWHAVVLGDQVVRLDLMIPSAARQAAWAARRTANEADRTTAKAAAAARAVLESWAASMPADALRQKLEAL